MVHVKLCTILCQTLGQYLGQRQACSGRFCSLVGRQPLESIFIKVNVEKVRRAKGGPREESLPVIPPGKLSLMSKLRSRQELFEIQEDRGKRNRWGR